MLPRKLALGGLPQAPYLLTDLQKALFTNTKFKIQVHTFNFRNFLSAYAHWQQLFLKIKLGMPKETPGVSIFLLAYK